MPVHRTLRRLMLLLLLIVTAALVAPSVASAASAAALGQLDSVGANDFSNTVVLSGWALDPSAKGSSAGVQVTVDGSLVGGTRAAALPRTDVNKAFSAVGGHGFVITMTLPAGTHQVCVSARTVAARGGSTSLGCFAFQAYRAATAAQMQAVARTIDPAGSITWVWTALPAGIAGQALPWNRTIDIASGNTTRDLRSVMLHEWSHVLQYRAFGTVDPWGDAVQAFNSLLGHPGDRSSYAGVEHGADCIALALGADYLGYGCPAALRAYGARIAHGQSMAKPVGTLESLTASGRAVTLSGWAMDPANPTSATLVRVLDNGSLVPSAVLTTLTRSDVNAVWGVSGAHGFVLHAVLTAGSHQICVSANPVTAGRAAATIAGCMTVHIG